MNPKDHSKTIYSLLSYPVDTDSQRPPPHLLPSKSSMLRQDDHARSTIVSDTQFHLQRTSIQMERDLLFIFQPCPQCVFRVHQEAWLFFNLLNVFGVGGELFGSEGPVGYQKL